MNFVDIQNVQNVCRLCLSMEEPKASVFADQTSSVSLVMKIQSCLSIEILTSDRASTMICVDCMRRVNKWYVYKEYCLRSQQKLQHCLGDQLENLGNIKVEPMDVYEPPSPLETVPLTTDDELESLPGRRVETIPMVSPAINHGMTMITAIKREVIDENGTLDEMNSFTSPELLINPMALTGHKEDRLMEADSTQKFINVKKTIKNSKKKLRRGPHTHFRGVRQFKQRCPHCQIYLHSKNSYANHMNRFHSGKIYERKNRRASNVEEDMRKVHSDENTEEIEDVEDELANLEKDSPLTPVQQNIISQLKTFSCYSCRQSFGDRRSTLNHIRQHMPDLRPYTCIACLTEFADRSIYKLHCGASFQCAMKIALVIPEHGTEKYFTCNMCLRSLSNRKELLSHLSRHSDKQYEQLLAHPFNAPPKLKPMTSFTSSPKNSLKTKAQMAENVNDASVYRKKGIPDPYKSGDPAYNHKCLYCGMIYRYKQNMFKHVTLCKHLPPEVRVCYRCVICGLTFLAFSKFQNHLSSEHKKRDIECSHCRTKFKQSSDFLQHYRDECTIRLTRVNQSSQVCDEEGGWEIENTDSSRPIENGKFGCALCPETVFDTRVKLVDHMKIHSNPTVFSCTICSCTFGNNSILEAHMADHEVGIPPPALEDNMSGVPLLEDERNYDTNASRFSAQSDVATNNTECNECGKVFANYPNLRRHVRSVHNAIGRFNCFTCAMTFVTEEQWQDHVDKEHESTSAMHACPLCPEIFETELSLNDHRNEVHGLNGEAHLACYICGKIFINETSLKIHRGHHFRVNSRLSIGNLQKTSMETEGANDEGEIIIETRKSPTARKSFPNGSPHARLMNFLQCQVCDERFNDVVDLRKHLWDVHCARAKPERNYASQKFQCELCTNVLPDEESLASHMKWHESNPILSHVEITDNVQEETQCNLCGKYYSSFASMRKHKRRHKLGVLGKFHGQTKKKNNGHVCTVCRKVFAGKTTLAKHKEVAHPARTSASIDDREIIRPVRPRLDFDAIVKNHGVLAKNDEKRSVNCNLCRRVVPNMRALYKHRQRVHKIVIEDDATALRDDYYDSANGDRIVCTVCDKNFSSVGNMRKHFKRVHSNARVSSQFKCSVEGCRLQFKNRLAKDNHEKTHSNLMYTCALCPRYMLSRASMDDHMLSAHRTNYARENNAILCKKIDLDNYVVKGANGRQCPLCKINYPNNKALKIHYLKVHEGGA